MHPPTWTNINVSRPKVPPPSFCPLSPLCITANNDFSIAAKTASWWFSVLGLLKYTLHRCHRCLARRDEVPVLTTRIIPSRRALRGLAASCWRSQSSPRRSSHWKLTARAPASARVWAKTSGGINYDEHNSVGDDERRIARKRGGGANLRVNILILNSRGFTGPRFSLKR